MEPRAVVEGALRALIAQEPGAFMSWFDDEVVYQVPPLPPVSGRFHYFREIAGILTPGSGARAAGFHIARVDQSDEGMRWVQTSVEFQVSADGRAFASGETAEATRSSEVWFGVKGNKIVEVKAFSESRPWRLSS